MPLLTHINLPEPKYPQQPTRNISDPKDFNPERFPKDFRTERFPKDFNPESERFPKDFRKTDVNQSRKISERAMLINPERFPKYFRTERFQC